MELEVGADLVDSTGVREAVEIEARPRHRVRHSAPPPVLEVDLAAERPAAEHSGLEAAPLLVVEGDDPERPPGLDTLGAKRAHRRQRGENSKGAVVAAAARHRVQMGADDDRLALPRAPAAEDVSRLVELRLETELVEPSHQPVVRLGELRAPGEARDAAAVGADLRRRLELSRERGHRASSSTGTARQRP